MVTLEDVLTARERIGPYVQRTPCAPAHAALSERLGCELFFKLENLQRTGSFKERGAANRLRLLSESERRRGVVTASAGNHAQGVACHARRMGVSATIVMPEGTPLVKIEATRAFGARVLLTGANYDEAWAYAMRVAEREERVLIHPFDDPAVVAGQGTVGLELLEQVPDLDAVVLGVGGGGLLAGVALVFEARRPGASVYGVEPASLPSMREALSEGRPVEVPPSSSIAEGIAVRRVGDCPFEVARGRVEEVVTVDDEEIAEAILVLLEQEKTVAEGAGAAPLAALLHGRLPVRGKKVAVVVSGGNIDVHLVSRILERGLAKSGRRMRLQVTLRDVPGALARLLETLAGLGANVLEVHHDRGGMVGLGEALVELVLETRGYTHVQEIEEALAARGLSWRRLHGVEPEAG